MVNIKKLVESELEKAQITLATTDISDTLQKMASQLSRLSIDDIPPVIERIKAEYGIEAGNQFSTSVTAKLNELTQQILSTKSNIDDEALILAGDAPRGSTMGDIDADLDMDDADIESDLDADIDELEGEDNGLDLDIDIDDDEPALGRKVKESRKMTETHERTPGTHFQSDDGLGAFRVSFKHPNGNHTETDRFEDRKDAVEYAKHLKKAGYTNISVKDTSRSSQVHEAKERTKGKDFQSKDGLGAFEVEFVHPDGKKHDKDRFEDRKDAERFVKHLKKAGFKSIEIIDTAKGKEKAIKEAKERTKGKDFQSKDGLGAFLVTGKHPNGKKTDSDRFEDRKDAKRYADHLKKAGYTNVEIEDTAKGKEKVVKESRESYPLIVERLLKDCDDKKKKIVESMYKSGKDGRKKVVELAKTIASSKKKKTETK